MSPGGRVLFTRHVFRCSKATILSNFFIPVMMDVQKTLQASRIWVSTPRACRVLIVTKYILEMIIVSYKINSPYFWHKKYNFVLSPKRWKFLLMGCLFCMFFDLLLRWKLSQTISWFTYVHSRSDVHTTWLVECVSRIGSCTCDSRFFYKYPRRTHSKFISCQSKLCRNWLAT